MRRKHLEKNFKKEEKIHILFLSSHTAAAKKFTPFL